MSDNANSLKKRLPGWLRQRSFLIRMLVTTLLAGCIPLIIISFLMISSEQNSVNDSARRQLASVTASVARQFDNYIEAATKINLKMQLDRKLFESAISVSVQGEIEALEVLEYMQTALPFASEYGLYLAGDIDAIYSMTGKYDTNVYAIYQVGVDPQKLANALTSSAKSYFFSWSDLSGSMLYIIPIRTGSAINISRVGLYVISAAKLQFSLGNLLADQYALAAIYDADNRLIYQEENCPLDLSAFGPADVSVEMEGKGISYLAYATASVKGYRVVVYMNKSAYLKSIENLTSYVGNLAFVNIFICIALIIMVVMLNYQSIAKVFQKIRGYDSDSAGTASGSKNELQYILDAFTGQVEEKDRLQLQLYEQHVLMYDRLLENLLEGQNLSGHDLQLLKFDSPYYYVVLAPLAEAKNVGAIISGNRIGNAIYAIEMYADGYLTFICSSEEASAAVCERLARQIRCMLEDEMQALGFSKAYTQVDQLFLAYLEAGHALNSQPPEVVPFADSLLAADGKLINEDPQSISQLTYAVKMGNEYALAFANRMFEDIQLNMPSLLMQRYACFQLVELFRKISENVGISMDIKRLSHILYNSNMATIQKEFTAMLQEQCENRRNQHSRALDITFSKVMQYINDNFMDPMFGMNSIADHLGMTIYTASRMLKTMIGINFRKYLNDMRIEYAKDLLLSTDLPIREVSEKAGFTSPSYFISIFKSSENVTPSNFRKR